MMNRREFAGALAASAWTARSYARIIGANDRLNVGVVGCGGMAGVHMNRLLKFGEKTDNFQFTAVCDLYDKRRDAAATLTGGKPFTRYHDLLASKGRRLHPERDTGTLALASHDRRHRSRQTRI